MDLHKEMAAAAAEDSRVVAGASTHPLDGPTPCTDWDLRTLLNHTILWTAYSAERRARDEKLPDELTSTDFTAQPDYAQAYAAQIDRAVTAWSEPGAWTRELGMMGTPTPSADVGALLVAEMVLHGWDIAKATGQDYRCDDAVARNVLKTVEAQGELFRQYQGFAAIVPVPDDAAAFDRALALSGRDPR